MSQHFALSAFQNSPDPKMVPLPQFDMGEAEINSVVATSFDTAGTASLRKLLKLS
jgi:hypothetical protein